MTKKKDKFKKCLNHNKDVKNQLKYSVSLEPSLANHISNVNPTKSEHITFYCSNDNKHIHLAKTKRQSEFMHLFDSFVGPTKALKQR